MICWMCKERISGGRVMKQCIGEVLGVNSQYDYYEEEGTVN